MYNILKHSDLTKRGGFRIDVFCDMIKDGEEFTTTKGLVLLDKSQYDEVKAKLQGKGVTMRLTGKKVPGNKPITLNYPKDFLKTPEFGGKGAGFTTRAEDRELGVLRKGLQAAMEKEKDGALVMKVGGRIVTVSDVVTTPGVPKSDFHLVDMNGEAVAWLSHKDGRKPTDFQQYGGLSDKVFSNNKEVKAFMDDLAEKFPDGLPPKTSVYRTVKDKNIVNQSVWGVDYGGARGKNNVDEFHQGPMKVVKKGKYYQIQSNHFGSNGEPLKGNGYEPIYLARYTSDRGARVAGKFVGNARVGVFPAAKAGGTSEEI